MSVLYAIKQGPSPTCVQLARTRACLHKSTHECTLLHAQNITHTHTLTYTHNPLAVVRGVWLTNHELLCVCDLVALMLCQHWVLLAHFRTFFFLFRHLCVGVPFSATSQPAFCAQLKCQLDAFLSSNITSSGMTVGGSKDILGHLGRTGEVGVWRC